MSEMKRLLLVDVFGLLYRCYFTMPRMQAPDGTPTNAVYGLARILTKLTRERKPDYLALAMDPPGGTFRETLYAEYKAHREKMPDDLRKQVPLALELFEAMGLVPVVAEGYEADDVIGALARQAEAAPDLAVEILTGDRDLLQLVTDRTRALMSRKGVSDLETFDPALVAERFGFRPDQMTDYKGLAGDSSDNIPGVRGVGEKTAIKLLEEHGSIESLYENLEAVSNAKLREKLEAGRENAFLSKKLASIALDAPVTLDLARCETREFPKEKLAAFFQKLAFNSLLKELDLKPPSERETPRIGDRCVNSLVSSEEELNELAREARKAGRMTVDLETTSLNPHHAEIVGVAVAVGPERAWYVPIGHRKPPPAQGDLFGEEAGAGEGAGALLEGQLPEKTVFEVLGPLLMDPSVRKDGHNLKFDLSVLRALGHDLKGIDFDTMLGSYLLNPNERRHGLKALSLSVLGLSQTGYEEVAGKGKEEVSFALVPIETARDYACGDVEAAARLREIQEPELKKRELDQAFWGIEVPLIEVLADMELAGIRVDARRLEELSSRLQRKEEAVRREAAELTGFETNLNSPKQVGELLYEKLGLPKQRGGGTDIKALTALAGRHPVVPKIVEVRHLSKLRSTYTDALQKLIDPKTGRVHTSFNQTGASTGRLSSSDPNLQNIPIRTEEGRAIRGAFVPGEKGWRLLAADYSQVEIRLLAHLSGDPILIESFRRNEDVHTRTAAEVFGVRPEDVDSDLRRRAKAINFGIIYGMKEYGLSQDLGIPVSEAAAFIKKYFEKYPAVERFIEETKEIVLRDGYVVTLFKRRRDIPEAFSGNRNDREFGFRAAVNARVQGTAADIIKIAMLEIHKELKRGGWKTRMLLQVHDELVFETPEEELPAAARMVREKMEGPLPGGVELKTPLLADLKQGLNWLEMETAHAERE